MSFFKRSAFLFILATLLVPMFGTTQASAFQSEAETNTPIEHFIVVMQQNHTFDNYFGTYPGANGIPQGVCVPASLSSQDSTSCVTPFKITDHPISDLNHSQTTFETQYQNGKMNGFVDALNYVKQDGTLSMGHFDDSNI